ncbi:MAG TPA: metal ABC transporter ATP-binding protein [Polyangiaceae bacterium]|nr:metal ABC transporter ATP-binding protein [Polyangiaceae bacterium]
MSDAAPGAASKGEGAAPGATSKGEGATAGAASKGEGAPAGATSKRGAAATGAASRAEGTFTRPERSADVVLEARGVTVELGGRRVLDDVSFWVPKGEFVCLCGPNGAGKSTFLKTALGLLAPTRGSVLVLGAAAGKVRAGKVGYVPQRKADAARFPAAVVDLLVANLRGSWPLRVGARDRQRARDALARVHAEHLIDRPLARLSGGEAQRVFLARALVTDPVLLILDEPTAGVDASGRAEFLDLLAALSASDELAAVLVTHNLAAVARCAERIVYLDAGRLVAWGLPDELFGRGSLSALAQAPVVASLHDEE